MCGSSVRMPGPRNSGRRTVRLREVQVSSRLHLVLYGLRPITKPKFSLTLMLCFEPPTVPSFRAARSNLIDFSWTCPTALHLVDFLKAQWMKRHIWSGPLICLIQLVPGLPLLLLLLVSLHQGLSFPTLGGQHTNMGN